MPEGPFGSDLLCFCERAIRPLTLSPAPQWGHGETLQIPMDGVGMICMKHSQASPGGPLLCLPLSRSSWGEVDSLLSWHFMHSSS